MAVRERPACTCNSRYSYGPHELGCPRYRDRSQMFFVLDALVRRYEGDGEWLTFEEAFHIDLLAVRCWSSGIGYRRIAHEVKVSRSDFLAEIRNPAKRQNALSLTHQFFFAVPKGLVGKEEVPSDSGLIVVDEGGRARLALRAPLRQPRPLKFSEAVGLMRRPLYRGGLLHLRREALASEASAEHSRKRAEGLQQRLDRAHERLSAYAAHLVVDGSMWKGRWETPFGQVEEAVEMYVEKVDLRSYRDGSGLEIVRLRRLDGKDTWPLTYYSRAEVLERFEPILTPSVSGHSTAAVAQG